MHTILPHEIGIRGSRAICRNAPVPYLVIRAVEKGAGELTETGALNIVTGKYTGRSPKDKFIVDSPAVHDDIAWGSVNQPFPPEKYGPLRERILRHLENRELFVFDGYAGADPKHAKGFRVVTEYACQCLFMTQLLIRPTEEELEHFRVDYTVYVAPGYQCDPERDGVNSDAVILLNLEAREVLIAGTRYSGEIKKSVFSIMNYVLPKEGVLSMHCSANLGPDGDTAVFFGLSGTGKTTLSADPARGLIGDDEHGWSDEGIFNIEGGCYAKCIGLDREKEPEIFDAIRFGAELENVVVDEKGHPDYNDARYTENSRAAYPVEFIPNAVIPGVGGIPKTVIFLTADAFGVLPPIARLDENMAMYHFVSGYTSKLAGTERGITEPVATFSTLFGEPFFPLRASVYASMLGQKLRETGARVFLVNTGWCGGHAGDVPRIKLRYTRAMVSAAIAGELDEVDYELDPIFHVYIPKHCPGVPSELLDPRTQWADGAAYAAAAKKLAQKFAANFDAKYPDMPENIRSAGPQA